MVIKTITGMSITGMAGIATYWATAQPYLPYLVGGLALFAYMVSNNECEFKIKDFSAVIGGAILVGWLSNGFTLVFSEIVFNWFVGLFPADVVSNSESLKNDDFAVSLSRVISFILAGLSGKMYTSFFSNRGKLLEKIIKKGMTKKDDN